MKRGSTSVSRKGTPSEEEFVMQIDMQGGNKAVFDTFTLVERRTAKSGRLFDLRVSNNIMQKNSDYMETRWF